MNIKQIFFERLPYRPYFTDNFDKGVLIRPKTTAIEHRNIQPNPHHLISWLVFDVDFQGAALAWEEAGLPPPTIISVNPSNGHAHIFYGLAAPVLISQNGRRGPIDYVQAIRTAFTIALKADTSYSGFMSKNPLHDHWSTIWLPKLYELGELNEYVLLMSKVQREQCDSWGRNCTLFELVRHWSYRSVMKCKRAGITYDRWQELVKAQAAAFNDFSPPLPLSEVRSVARSVARSVWSYFSEAKFAALRSARGKRGGRPKTTCSEGEPWVALGISRATYYRRHYRQGMTIAPTVPNNQTDPDETDEDPN